MSLAALEQGSEEWLLARVGKVTASRMADVCAKTKSGWGAGRKNYMAELAAERLTGVPSEGFVNAAMQWGKDTEPQARAAYEFFTDAQVQEVGLIEHPSIPMTAASPDGFVGEDGMVEIKCPNTATHIDTLLGQEIPGKYILQMQWQMICADRQWCDFVSFDPRLPANLQLFIKRVERDEKKEAELTDLVTGFLSELDGMVASLEKLNELTPLDAG